MGRIQKDVVEYFPHDANASSGDTIKVLTNRFGNDGYGFWFRLLEKLASTEGHYIDCSNSVRWQLLLAHTGINDITGVDIMKILVEMKAIDEELWKSKIIWCQKLIDNLQDVYKNRRRDVPKRPIPTKNKPITTNNNSISTDKRERESKVERVKRLYGEFNNISLSDDEYKKLTDKFGRNKTDTLIEELSIAIQSKGYRYKNHYATILNWQRRKEVPVGKSNPRSIPKIYTKPEDL